MNKLLTCCKLIIIIILAVESLNWIIIKHVEIQQILKKISIFFFLEYHVVFYRFVAYYLVLSTKEAVYDK